jgi:hypothetical protein
MEPRVRPTLHPVAIVGLIGAGLMLVLLVVGIAMLVAILKDSRDHIRAQDAKTAVLLSKLAEATPTARQVPPLISEARPAVRRLGRSIEPVTRAVTATAEATDQLPGLVRDTRTLAALAIPVLDELGRVDVAHVLTAGGSAADAVLYRDRLVRALDSTNRLLTEVRAEDLIPASAKAARETPRLIRHLVRLQTTTLRTQRATLQTLLASLDIQRQTLTSVKSIDRKTGGTVPPQGPPVPAP